MTEWKQREIKFKFWDERHNRPEEDVIIYPDGEVYHNEGSRLGGRAYGVIPRQFTGLKDKNGREIYEGDILHFDTDYPTSTGNYLIKWDRVEACWDCENINNWMAGSEWKRAEVIGSIFESPELLEV